MIPEFFPRERYYCVLDDQPDFLVPPTALPALAALNGHAPLVVNPRCWMGWHGALPPALASNVGSAEALLDFPWTIWVDDPERGTLWPYWLGREYAHMLQHLAPGQPYGGDLPDAVVDRLRVAGILVASGAAAQQRHSWAYERRLHGQQMAAGGYLSLSGLLPPYHLGALRRYYRYHTRMGTFTLGDEQTPGRYVAYDEPLTQFVHRQLASTISDVAQRVLVPSYNYVALYQGGAVLEPHTDREECEYTLSLCIDATPDPHTYGAWPLHLMTPGGVASVTLGIGDGLLFRGRELAHWRDRLPEGYTSSSILFHFVDGAAPQ